MDGIEEEMRGSGEQLVTPYDGKFWGGPNIFNLVGGYISLAISIIREWI
jgi:hypothetical protein